MHLEIRKRGKKRLFYVAHAFRDGGRVRKVRRYLGADLKKEEIENLRGHAEKSIRDQIEAYNAIKDPLHTMLSKEEKRRVNALIAKEAVRVTHLSEEEWLRFTELFTYDTNAIEGSTVSVSEVRGIIECDAWPTERSKGEISETYGVAEALRHIRKTKEHLSLELIKRLHEIVFRNSKPFAGRFRGKGIEVVVTDGRGKVIHRGAPQHQIVSLLRELIGWYRKNEKTYHPIVLAAVIHNQFENIHPFQDGNGRVGRLLLNNILLKHGLPPVNIELKNRSEYYSSLQSYQNQGNLRPSIELILKEYRKLKRSLGKK